MFLGIISELLFQILFVSASAILGTSLVVFGLKRRATVASFPIEVSLGICMQILLSVAVFSLNVGNSAMSISATLFIMFACFLIGRSNFSRSIPYKVIAWRIALSAVLVIISTVAAYFIGFPPPGDITGVHGPLVAELMSLKYLPLSVPLPAGSILYPPGLHSLAAQFANYESMNAPFSLLSVATAICFLIPFLVASLTWQMTKSQLLTLVAGIATISYNSVNLEGWLIGNLLNGTYPYLVGLLLIMTLVCLLEEDKDLWSPVKFLLLFAASIITYPAFALLMILLLGIVVTGNRFQFQSIRKFLEKDKGVFYTCFVIAALFATALVRQGVSINVVRDYMLGVLYFGGQGFGSSLTVSAYQFHPTYLLSPVGNILLATVIVFILAVVFFERKILFKNKLSIVFATLIVIMTLSLSQFAYQFVRYLEPSRLFLLSFLIAVPLICKLVQTFKIAATIKSKWIMGSKHFRSIILPVFAIIIVSISLIPYHDPTILTGPNWFPEQPYFSANYQALVWMADNIPSHALILNDGSYSSMTLQSFDNSNLTLDEWNESVHPSETASILKFWSNPYDYDYFRQIARELNISYVYSSDEWGYHLYGDNSGYSSRIMSPQQYASALSSSPYLQPVFSDGYNIVYKVVDLNRSFFQVSSNLLGNETSFFQTSASWGAGGEVGTPNFLNSTAVTIPSGSNTSWGIYHSGALPRLEGNASFVRLEIITNRLIGVSLVFGFNDGSISHIDFITGPNATISYLKLPNFLLQKLQNVTQISLATGFLPPYGLSGDVINVVSISFVGFD